MRPGALGRHLVIVKRAIHILEGRRGNRVQTAAGRPSLPGRHLRAFFSAVCAEGEKFKPSVRSAKGAGVGQRDTPPSFLWVWDSGVAEQGRSMAGNP